MATISAVFDVQGDTTAVDIWAAGVVFAEMLRRKRLISESSTMDRLLAIIHLLGVETALPCSRTLQCRH